MDTIVAFMQRLEFLVDGELTKRNYHHILLSDETWNCECEYVRWSEHGHGLVKEELARRNGKPEDREAILQRLKGKLLHQNQLRA